MILRSLPNQTILLFHYLFLLCFPLLEWEQVTSLYLTEGRGRKGKFNEEYNVCWGHTKSVVGELLAKIPHFSRLLSNKTTEFKKIRYPLVLLRTQITSIRPCCSKPHPTFSSLSLDFSVPRPGMTAVCFPSPD